MVVKIVLLGESGVGKTNILQRYKYDKFDADQKATIGMDFVTNEVVIDMTEIKVQFWDTAGQEKYKTIAR